MSATSIIERIKTETARKVDEVTLRTNEQIEKINQKAEMEIQRLHDLSQDEVAKRQQQIEIVAAAKATQMAQKITQQAQRTALDSAFSDVVQSVVSTSGDDYITFFQSHARQQLPENIEIARVDIPQNREEETRKIVSIPDTASITINPHIKAGMIVYTTRGVFDLSLERMLEQVKTSLEMQIVTILKQ
jgi:vacuolar-type H+-ATPase subunit E/Vma4